MEPLLKTLLIVGGLDVVVLGLVFFLFWVLNSQATAAGPGPGLSNFQASGALAGFVILMAVQLYAIKWFLPEDMAARPSYGTILSFYQNLQHRQYKSAWKLISSDMQRSRWDGDEARFVSGFRNTQEISFIAIGFVSELNPYHHEYVVYYLDKTEAPVLPGLEKLGEKDVENLPAINDSITALRKLLLERGLDTAALDKMKIHQLMTAIRGDILRWRIENSTGAKKAGDIFPTSKTVSRLVGKRITVGLPDEKWLIEKIEEIPYNEE